MIYEGLLALHGDGEADDILFLSSLERPLAEELEWMTGKNVSVRYWIADKSCTREEAMRLATLEMMGVADVEYVVHHSDMTGYLWTDENIKVGGHNLLDELGSHVGKWLILEVVEGVRYD